MTKRTRDIAKRDAKRDLGSELLQAVRDIKAGRGRRFAVGAGRSRAGESVDRR